jgi:hypothetical protein
MIYITLPDSVKNASREDERKFITSDETWAFIEHPNTDRSGSEKRQIAAHDLFSLFTADIIQENILFRR